VIQHGLLFVAAMALLAGACSKGSSDDEVPALPEQTAESANALMAGAERAAADAARRSETAGVAARSRGTDVNEVTP
jgi:hypothetical protein